MGATVSTAKARIALTTAQSGSKYGIAARAEANAVAPCYVEVGDDKVWNYDSVLSQSGGSRSLKDICGVRSSSTHTVSQKMSSGGVPWIDKDCVVICDSSNVPLSWKTLGYLNELLNEKSVWKVHVIGSSIKVQTLDELKGMCGDCLHCELYPKKDKKESDYVDLRIAELITKYSRIDNVELVCFTGDGNRKHGVQSISSAVIDACSRDVCVCMYAPRDALAKIYIGVPNISLIDWNANSPSLPQRTTSSTVDYQSDVSSHSLRSSSNSPQPPSSGSARSSSSSPQPLGGSAHVPNGGKCFVRDVTCDGQHSTSPRPMPIDLVRILQAGQHSTSPRPMPIDLVRILQAGQHSTSPPPMPIDLVRILQAGQHS
jgi:hypothetical protein